MSLGLWLYIGALVLMSVITFCLYAADKAKAKRGAWRIPERVLLLMSLFGGAYGGFIAMQLLRHKTRAEHWYFTAVNVAGMLLWAALPVLWYYRGSIF